MTTLLALLQCAIAKRPRPAIVHPSVASGLSLVGNMRSDSIQIREPLARLSPTFLIVPMRIAAARDKATPIAAERWARSDGFRVRR
jgi:hypothetical protein